MRFALKMIKFAILCTIWCNAFLIEIPYLSLDLFDKDSYFVGWIEERNPT